MADDPLLEEFEALEREVRRRECPHEKWVNVSTHDRPDMYRCAACGLERPGREVRAEAFARRADPRRPLDEFCVGHHVYHLPGNHIVLGRDKARKILRKLRKGEPYP